MGRVGRGEVKTTLFPYSFSPSIDKKEFEQENYFIPPHPSLSVTAPR